MKFDILVELCCFQCNNSQGWKKWFKVKRKKQSNFISSLLL